MLFLVGGDGRRQGSEKKKRLSLLPEEFKVRDIACAKFFFVREAPILDGELDVFFGADEDGVAVSVFVAEAGRAFGDGSAGDLLHFGVDAVDEGAVLDDDGDDDGDVAWEGFEPYLDFQLRGVGDLVAQSGCG